jgi:hypothetical protein
MKKILLSVIVINLLLLHSVLFAQILDMDSPIVIKLPGTSQYTIPPGLKVDCIPDQNALKSAPLDCPVIDWNEYIYWAYSYLDNRDAIVIVAYDIDGNIVKQWKKSGARYIYKITVDAAAATVTFWGQADKKIVMTWLELYLKTPPVVGEVPSKIHPAVPSDLKVACMTGPDIQKVSPNCPIIEWNEYTYWAYSFIDDRDAMGIIAYDVDGNIAKRWDKKGARLVYKITVNNVDQTVTFWGQSDQKIVMSWNDLYLMPPPVVAIMPSKLHPTLPPDVKVDCKNGPNSLDMCPDCPILEWGNYKYWAYSYIDNRVAMDIVAYDESDKIVKQWEKSGARYVYKITVDTAAETATFWGQSDHKIVVSWKDLVIR